MAIGRAPTAKMSRRIPPTPVAAPWKGSTALGWLCDSTLKATERPPPTSTAPAFSPGPMHQPRPLGRQRPQQRLGVLVGAVLGPQQREHRELDLVGLASQPPDDELVLGCGRGRARARARRPGGERRGVGGWRRRVARRGAPERASAARASCGAAASEANRPSPSVEPVSTSTACSGWGIRPNTLPRSLTTPAMSSSEPLGFSPGRVAEHDLAAGVRRSSISGGA